jgi:hypothetical protein
VADHGDPATLRLEIAELVLDGFDRAGAARGEAVARQVAAVLARQGVVDAGPIGAHVAQSVEAAATSSTGVRP